MKRIQVDPGFGGVIVLSFGFLRHKTGTIRVMLGCNEMVYGKS